jgi:G:T/U-mismatch repair DNA glycosylase
MLERQKHPFQPYIPQDAIALIIGTAPPWNLCTTDPRDLREGEIPFFYGSIHNLFWYIMKAVFEPDNPRWPRNALQCENFLKRWRLGIGDILESFVRKDRKAADDHLSGFKYNSRLLAKLHSEHSEIRYLYFTSQFAADLFLKSLKKHAYIYHIQKEDRSRKNFLLTLQYGKQAYYFTCFVLNSPSPRINRSLGEMVEDYRAKFNAIFRDVEI